MAALAYIHTSIHTRRLTLTDAIADLTDGNGARKTVSSDEDVIDETV